MKMQHEYLHEHFAEAGVAAAGPRSGTRKIAETLALTHPAATLKSSVRLEVMAASSVSSGLELVSAGCLCEGRERVQDRGSKMAAAASVLVAGGTETLNILPITGDLADVG